MEISGVKGLIPAEEIVDIIYEISSIDVRLNIYRPGVISEKDYYDPDSKKEAKRKANLADAIKKYGETYAKVKEKAAKRHLEYKIAVLTARQALDQNADLEPAIKRLSAFKVRHPNSWQFTACLELLGRLQVDAKQYQEAEETYLDLAQADVPEDTKQEAELWAAQVGDQGRQASSGAREAAKTGSQAAQGQQISRPRQDRGSGMPTGRQEGRRGGGIIAAGHQGHQRQNLEGTGL